MSVTTTNTIEAKLIYTDLSNRTYKIPVSGEMSQEIYDNAKTQIRAFNTAAQDTTSSVYQTFRSVNGAPVSSIYESTLVTTEEEVIYSNG